MSCVELIFLSVFSSVATTIGVVYWSESVGGIRNERAFFVHELSSPPRIRQQLAISARLNFPQIGSKQSATSRSPRHRVLSSRPGPSVVTSAKQAQHSVNPRSARQATPAYRPDRQIERALISVILQPPDSGARASAQPWGAPSRRRRRPRARCGRTRGCG